MANSEKRGENESKLFLNCTAWRGTAELLGKYFSKGQEVVVEGALYQREYTDRDGNKRTVTEMPSVDRIHFCGSKQTNSEGSGIAGHGDGITDPVGDGYSTSSAFGDAIDDSELPF